MGASRLCVFLAVLVSVKMMAAQPIFGSRMWCDMMCDDDDDDDDYSDYDFLDFFFDPLCGGCTTKKPTKNKTTTPSPGTQLPVNFILQNDNGMNVTVTNTGTSWWMNFMPGGAKPAATTAPPATTEKSATTTAAGTTAAGSTTAEPSTTAKT